MGSSTMSQSGFTTLHSTLISIKQVTESTPVAIKNTTEDTALYPNHAFAKGGVGVLLATGAKAGISKLPQTVKAAAKSRRYSASEIGSSYGESLVSGNSPIRQGTCTIVAQTTPNSPSTREWEKAIPHTHNFCSTGRTTRVHDVPKASKWVGISFFENNPQEVKRHMDVMAWHDQVHVQSKLMERETERQRHRGWAEQQRQTFRRQRLEQAGKYAKAGILPGVSYAWAAAEPGSMSTGTSLVSEQLEGSQPGSLTATGVLQNQAVGSGASSMLQTAGSGVHGLLHSYGSAAHGLLQSYGSGASQLIAAAKAAQDLKASRHASAPRASQNQRPYSGMTTLTITPYGSRPGTTIPHARSPSRYSSGIAMSDISDAMRSVGAGSPVLSTGVALQTSLSLPRPSFHKVHARIYAEAEQGAIDTVQAINMAKEEAEKDKQAAEVEQNLKALDEFESHLRVINRKAGRDTPEL